MSQVLFRAKTMLTTLCVRIRKYYSKKSRLWCKRVSMSFNPDSSRAIPFPSMLMQKSSLLRLSFQLKQVNKEPWSELIVSDLQSFLKITPFSCSRQWKPESKRLEALQLRPERPCWRCAGGTPFRNRIR